MSGKSQITVRQMQAGQSGTVVQILSGPGRHGRHGHGGPGRGLADRIYALGIRPGVRITKVSSMFMRGPVTLQVDRAQIAIGYGMAGGILVEVDSGE